MYETPRDNVKVERGSTFTFTRDLPNIASILFTRAVFSPGRGLAGFPQEKLKWRIKTKKMGKLRVKRTFKVVLMVNLTLKHSVCLNK